MDDREVGWYWSRNAPTWTRLVRAGYDVYRDLVNTPAFLALLPDVSGARGIDLGCGDGHNTRLVADRGAAMTGLDIAAGFVAAAHDEEARNPRGISYVQASAAALPFPGGSFDFACAFMSLMDMPDPRRVLAEAARVLRPGGFLQFSIEHPFATTAYRRWIRDGDGAKQALAVAGYFDQGETIDTWLFGSVPVELRESLPPFQVPRFRRTLSQWLNAVADAGLAVEAADEPRADEATAAHDPRVADTGLVPYFLHLRCRRPA
ncbi:MAG: class I SAM-dependent methyltransferase [Pseudonocardiaceae bacterium]